VLLKVNKILAARSAQPVSVQIFSSLKRVGIDQAHAVLDAWLRV
jgi:hypothetical protein